MAMKAASYGSTPLISAISDSNDTLVATISWNTPGNSQYNWPTQPVGMAYDSGKGEIFVSDVHDGNVFVFNDSTYANVATIQVETSAGEMVYDPARGEVFVANSYQVSVINDSTNNVVANISVSATSLAYDPTLGEVLAYNGSAISVINDGNNQVAGTITGITGGSTSIAYDSVKGETFAGAIIQDSQKQVVGQLPAGTGSIVYDSGRGEVITTTSVGLDLFSDSSVASTSTTTAPSTNHYHHDHICHFGPAYDHHIFRQERRECPGIPLPAHGRRGVHRPSGHLLPGRQGPDGSQGSPWGGRAA